jgi:hypothetical protein
VDRAVASAEVVLAAACRIGCPTAVFSERNRRNRRAGGAAARVWCVCMAPTRRSRNTGSSATTPRRTIDSIAAALLYHPFALSAAKSGDDGSPSWISSRPLRSEARRPAATQDIQHSSRCECNKRDIVSISPSRHPTLPCLRQRHRRSTHARCRTDPATARTTTASATSSARSAVPLSSLSWASLAQPPPAGFAVVPDRWSPRSSSPRTSRHSEPGS